MLINYSSIASTLWSTDGYKQFFFLQKEDSAPNTHRKENYGVALARQGKKTKYKIRVTYHWCQNKGQFSYEYKYPAPVLWDEVVVHLNAEAESQEEIPYFHFLNLVEDNSDASIEEILFGDDYYPVELNDGDSLASSLDE